MLCFCKFVYEGIFAVVVLRKRAKKGGGEVEDNIFWHTKVRNITCIQ